MTQVGDIAEQLRANGWRQGSVLSAANCSALGLFPNGARTHAVVASQDCDVVADVQVEPQVELLAAVETSTPDPGTLYGKHPRCLTLPTVDSNRHLELDVRKRVFVPKNQLAEFAPDGEVRLSHRDARAMAKWLGKRYTRDAFPDTFNRRLASARNRIERVSKSEDGKVVTDIFVSLEPYFVELPDGEPYKATFLFIFRETPGSSDARRAATERFAAALAKAISSCTGIDVEDDWEILPHGEVRLADLETMRRFDFDYRSAAPRSGEDSATGC